jgi:hypothetical protein
MAKQREKILQQQSMATLDFLDYYDKFVELLQ